VKRVTPSATAPGDTNLSDATEEIIISDHLITAVAKARCGMGGFLQDLAR